MIFWQSKYLRLTYYNSITLMEGKNSCKSLIMNGLYKSIFTFFISHNKGAWIWLVWLLWSQEVPKHLRINHEGRVCQMELLTKDFKSNPNRSRELQETCGHFWPLILWKGSLATSKGLVFPPQGKIKVKGIFILKEY